MQKPVTPVKTVGFGRLTQTAGTAIVRTINPRKNRAGGRNPRTRVTKLVYTAGITAHTLTVMKPFGTTTTTAGAIAGATVINITADAQAPSAAGALAALDYLVLELDGGAFQTVVVTSVAALAITVPALSAAMASGNKVWMFGVAADHADTYALTASTTTTLGGPTLAGRNNLGFVESRNAYEPILLHSDNATTAGTMEQVSGCYTAV